MIVYKDGSEAKIGDVIRWRVWDSDDFTTWIFTGLVKSRHVVYLGGGIDFGIAIGSKKSFEDVIADSENNDTSDRGIEKIGSASELARLVGSWNGE